MIKEKSCVVRAKIFSAKHYKIIKRKRERERLFYQIITEKTMTLDLKEKYI